MSIRTALVHIVFVASIGASIATSESEPLPPQSSPEAFEYDAVQLDTTATAGQGFSGQAGASVLLHTTAQPGADSVGSAVQLELLPSGGTWPGDVHITVSDTRTARVWELDAQAGTGSVFVEIEDAYENCWGQGFVPSCESGFEAVLSGPAGTALVWDARLVGDAELGDYAPQLVGEVQ